MDSLRHAPTLAELTTLGSLGLTLSLSSDGNWLAMGGSDGSLTVVSTRNRSNLRKLAQVYRVRGDCNDFSLFSA
jgi:hypothetical protein